MSVAFSNRKAGFIWGFAACWLGMLLAFTYLFVRDGPPPGYSLLSFGAIFAFFWAGGIALAAFTMSKPFFLVTVEGGRRVSATWRYPHKVVRKQFDSASVHPAEVVDSKDDEGDPYYYARVKTTGSEVLDLAESHDRPTCEAACERFNRALQAGR